MRERPELLIIPDRRATPREGGALPARLTLRCGTVVEGLVVDFGPHGARFRGPDSFPSLADSALVDVWFLGQVRMAHVRWQKAFNDGTQDVRIVGLEFIRLPPPVGLGR